MTAAQAQALMEKLSELSEERLQWVEYLVDFLLKRKQASDLSLPPKLLEAIEAGHITPPASKRGPSSTKDRPPASVPGRPLSEVILEDRP